MSLPLLSLLLPPSVSVHISPAAAPTPAFVKRQGPRGVILKKRGSLSFRGVATPEGRRLFVLPSASASPSAASDALTHLASAREGLTRGFRRRLRLVGVGFRATASRDVQDLPALSLKLGYSHDVRLPLAERRARGRDRTASRLEGRSKGTLLRLEGGTRAALHHAAAVVRDLRRPDPYKGKGIHYDREVLRLKKGKREGLSVRLARVYKTQGIS